MTTPGSCGNHIYTHHVIHYIALYPIYPKTDKSIPLDHSTGGQVSDHQVIHQPMKMMPMIHIPTLYPVPYPVVS